MEKSGETFTEDRTGEIKKKLTALKKLNKNALAFSIYDDERLEEVEKILQEIGREKVV